MADVKVCVCVLILLNCFACITSEGSDEMWWEQEFVFSIPTMLFVRPEVYITTCSTRIIRTTLEYTSTGYTVSTDISLSSPANIWLDRDIGLGPLDRPQNKTIIIRSEGNVSVHAIDNNLAFGDGYVVYPNSQLGTEYYVSSYTPGPSYTSLFCVSSIQLFTSVYIKTKAGKTQNIILKKYETYRFDGENGEDLSGTLIQSNKPMSVISGAIARIPSHIDYDFVEGILEQLVPTNQWQRSFVLTPFLTLPSGYIYRIYSMNVKTKVNISGSIIVRLEQGSFYEGNVEKDKVFTITADNPVMVVQYTKSGTTNDPQRGDPSMVVIPPVTPFAQGLVTFPVFQFSRPHEHFINVVIDCNNIDGLFLDDMTDFKNWDRLTTEDNETCCLRGSVTSGQHTVSNTDPTASFYVLVYSVTCCSAYAYTTDTCYVEDTFEGATFPPGLTTEAPTSINIPVTLSIAAVVLNLVIIIVATVTGVVVACKRYRKKPLCAGENDHKHRTPIRGMTELQETTGDINQGYEAPSLPPVNLDSKYNYATPDIPHGDRTYEDLDGNQRQRTYHEPTKNMPSKEWGTRGDDFDVDQGYEHPSRPSSNLDLVYAYATSDSIQMFNESEVNKEYSCATP